jgi:hypothetical protein
MVNAGNVIKCCMHAVGRSNGFLNFFSLPFNNTKQRAPTLKNRLKAQHALMLVLLSFFSSE